MTTTTAIPAGAFASLSRTWFGAGLSPQTQARLAELGRVDHRLAGTQILTEGEPTDDFAIVAAGRVALRMLVPERGMVTILTVEAGDVLGWTALVPPHRSTATAVALEPVELLAFEGAKLRAALAADPTLAATIYPRVLQSVARRLAVTRLQLLDLFAHEAATRSEIAPW